MQKTWQVLRQNGGYLGLAFALFMLGTLLGSQFADQFQEWIKASLEHLRGIAEQIQEQDSALYTSQVIFLNNLRAAVTMLLLGSLFAVFTVFAMLINGLMVGVVFALASTHAGTSLFDMIVFGLMPHGIFELPAIFIAAAFGIKLGRVLLWPLAGKTRWESYKGVWREVWQVSWLLLLLLVVAAGVEGMLTPVLLETFAS